MQIDIQALNFTLTDGLHARVEHRLRLALTRFQDQIGGISVRLSDINGPKGGADKRCLMRSKANGLPDIVVVDIEADFYVAVDRAVGRARRTLERHRTRAGSPSNDPFQRGGDGDL
ncbi:MAG: HPF/RaiA family ribosome-associated protein [Luteimonas sp.]